jgi:hypothetical protein
MLRFHIPLPTDLSVFRRLYFGIDFLPALCYVFSSVAILSATLRFIVFFSFLISANLLIWVVISTLMRVWSVQKYEETYNILLCGDMNASLHRDDRRRDRIFKKFTVESNLILPTNYPIDFTFHHHNGKSKSQIDYILFKGKTLNLQPSVSIMPFDAINTSDHTLIKVFLASLDAWSMLRFHIPLPTDLSVFRRLYFGIDEGIVSLRSLL